MHSSIVYGVVRRLDVQILAYSYKEILKGIEVTELDLFESTWIKLKELIGKKQVENETLSMIP